MKVYAGYMASITVIMAAVGIAALMLGDKFDPMLIIAMALLCGIAAVVAWYIDYMKR